MELRRSSAARRWLNDELYRLQRMPRTVLVLIAFLALSSAITVEAIARRDAHKQNLVTVEDCLDLVAPIEEGDL